MSLDDIKDALYEDCGIDESAIREEELGWIQEESKMEKLQDDES